MGTARATYAPVSSLNLRAPSVLGGTKDIVRFFFLSLSSPVFLTEMGLSPSDVVPKQLRSHLNALVSIPANLVSADRIQRSSRCREKEEKKNVNAWASKQTSVTPLSYFQPLTVR